MRALLERTVGADWTSRLPRRARESVEASVKVARQNRPNEVLKDDWEATGLQQIRLVARWAYDDVRVAEVLSLVWPSLEECEVDLNRLQSYRGGTLHLVGSGLGYWENREMEALVMRIRLGFEDIRRRMDDSDDEYWPYIESITTNVEGWRYVRTGTETGRCENPNGIPPKFFAGDIAEFHVNAVNPQGPQEDLVFMVWINAGNSFDHRIDWQSSPIFRLTVEEGRDNVYHFLVATARYKSGGGFSKSSMHALGRPQAGIEPVLNRVFGDS